MSDVLPETARPAAPSGSLAVLGLAALGIVFGDIGTSPLYTLKTVLAIAGNQPDAGVAFAGDLDAHHRDLNKICDRRHAGVRTDVCSDADGTGLMPSLGETREIVTWHPRAHRVKLRILLPVCAAPGNLTAERDRNRPRRVRRLGR